MPVPAGKYFPLTQYPAAQSKRKWHLSYLTAYALFPLLQAGSGHSGRSVLPLLQLHFPVSVPGQPVFLPQKQPFQQPVPFSLFPHSLHPENQTVSDFLHEIPAFLLKRPCLFHCASHNNRR